MIILLELPARVQLLVGRLDHKAEILAHLRLVHESLVLAPLQIFILPTEVFLQFRDAIARLESWCRPAGKNLGDFFSEI